MQNHVRVIDISKEEIFGLDFSHIHGEIQKAESDRKILDSEMNSWEITFSDYMSDPRPLPSIPEVTAWVNGSVDAGIPWFYFLRTGIRPQSLLLLLACGAKATALSPDGPYLIDVNRFKAFVSQNLCNLKGYVEKNGLPSESSNRIANAVMRVVREIIQVPDE